MGRIINSNVFLCFLCFMFYAQEFLGVILITQVSSRLIYRKDMFRTYDYSAVMALSPKHLLAIAWLLVKERIVRYDLTWAKV